MCTSQVEKLNFFDNESMQTENELQMSVSSGNNSSITLETSVEGVQTIDTDTQLPKFRKKLMKTPHSVIRRRPWATPEKYAARKAFKSFLTSDIGTPTEHDCMEAVRNQPELRGRTIKQIQMFVINMINRAKNPSCKLFSL